MIRDFPHECFCLHKRLFASSKSAALSGRACEREFAMPARLARLESLGDDEGGNIRDRLEILYIYFESLVGQELLRQSGACAQ